MDLDLQTYSVGGDSTINRIATFAEDIKTTGRSHNRIIVMDVFGRYAGHTAFRAGVAAEADAILIPEVPVDFNILYEHAKTTFMRRVAHSDVLAGIYLIIVAEGLKDASGKELVDENAAVDAFGHKRLAGAGKYVCDQLNNRFKADPSVPEFLKQEHLYVKNLYETPEVRGVSPGHLVRSGHSSAYDVNFGKEAGAAAVLLLQKGISGVTVVGVDGKTVRYMDTPKAIVQRHVDLNMVAFYESLGICFGRKAVETSLQFEKFEGPISRHL
jgi:6-phosphofructokinase 1